MPSSRPNHIPTVLGVVGQLKPTSILDVGIGFGKWGHLFREYTEIVHAESDPGRYRRENWKVRIDGVEGFQSYITPMHEYLYDHLYVGDMREEVPRLGVYDLIFLGDVIEHVTKADGLELLRACLDRAVKAVLVTTPATFVEQGAVCDNQLERHRSSWAASDFHALGRGATAVENDILIGVLPKEGVPMPKLQAAKKGGWRRFVRKWTSREPT